MAGYASNFIAYLQVARKTWARVEVVPNDEQGQISVDALRGMMDEDVRLISLTHVPPNGALVMVRRSLGRATVRDLHGHQRQHASVALDLVDVLAHALRAHPAVEALGVRVRLQFHRLRA